MNRHKLVTLAATLFLAAPALLFTSGSALVDDDTYAPDIADMPAGVYVVSSSRTVEGDTTVVQRTWSNGVKDATITSEVSSGELGWGPPECKPKVTEADLDRFVNSLSLSAPVGTGPMECGYGLAEDESSFGGGTGRIKIPDYRCDDPVNLDGNDVHALACVDYRFRKWNPDTGQTWWSAKAFTTAWSNDGQHGDSCIYCDHITRYSVYNKHTNGRVIAWSPTVTRYPESSCYTRTITAEKSGVSVSRETDVCAESYGPWANGDHSAGGRWEHDSGVHGDRRSANFVDVATTRAASDTFKVQQYVRWEID